nr:Fic family protein [Bacillus mycoides]
MQELHFQLLHYSTSDSGQWRYKPLTIPGIPVYEGYITSYRLLPYERVPQSVKELWEQYNALRANKDIHALTLIARFMLNFYCIVPFDQGNPLNRYYVFAKFCKKRLMDAKVINVVLI